MKSRNLTLKKWRFTFLFKIFLALAIAFYISIPLLKAQNIGINGAGTAPDASAMLDVESTDRGLLIPRVSLTATTNPSPVTGPTTSLLVYNTNTNAPTPATAVYPGFYYWDGTQWIPLGNKASDDWKILGNDNTNPGTNFLGTIDEQALIFRAYNTPRMRINHTGEVLIGYTGTTGATGPTGYTVNIYSDKTGTGAMYINGNSLTEGTGLDISATGLTTGKGLAINAGTSLTSGNALYVSGGAAASSGNIVQINTSGVSNFYSGMEMNVSSMGTNGRGMTIKTATPGQNSRLLSVETAGTASAAPANYNFYSDIGCTGVTGTRNYAAYLTASGAANNHALVVPLAGGNVGIGTVLPDSKYKLEVYDNSGADLSAGINVSQYGTQTNNGYAIYASKGGGAGQLSSSAIYANNQSESIQSIGVYGAAGTGVSQNATGVYAVASRGNGGNTSAFVGSVSSVTSTGSTHGIYLTNQSYAPVNYGVRVEKTNSTDLPGSFANYGGWFEIKSSSPNDGANYAGYFTATHTGFGAVANYALVVPKKEGVIGFGNKLPDTSTLVTMEHYSLTSLSKVLHITRGAAGPTGPVGGTGYGVYVQQNWMGSTTNVASYFDARNGSNNYAIIVPSGGGNVGIGTSAPSQLFSIADKFNVDTDGDLIKINNIDYSWPGAQGTAGQVLSIQGISGATGTLEWADAASATATGMLQGDGLGGVTGVTGTTGAVAYWSGTNTVESGVVGTTGYVLASGGSGAPTWTQMAGVPKGMEVFAAGGTWTNPDPTTIRQVWVKVWAGGGGGATGTGVDNNGGGGGGGGAYSEGLVGVTGSAVVVVGAGGVTGVTGGASSFTGNTIVSANGGSPSLGVAGGAGGTISGAGTIRIAGGSGSSSATGQKGIGGGNGGASPFGGAGGAGGAGGNDNQTLPGNAGMFPGGGGGGGSDKQAEGGAGAGGYVIIYW